MPLNQALDSNNMEMTKRLKYTKDILTHMLNNVQTVGGTNNQQQPGSRPVPHSAKGPAPPQAVLKPNTHYSTGLQQAPLTVPLRGGSVVTINSDQLISGRNSGLNSMARRELMATP